VDDVEIHSPAIGANWRVLVQRPAAPPTRSLPWLWLLHGSTSSADDMRPVLLAAARAMDDGAVPPMIIAAPDAPDGQRSSWWVDSSYEPPADQPEAVGERVPRAGRALERGLLGDVLPALEERYGSPSRVVDRVIGGISMGGAAALRWLLVRPDLFGAAILLSPAVYHPSPAEGSSARLTGAFGVGPKLFDPDRFRELMDYPTLLTARPLEAAPTKIIMLVGDEEPVQSNETGRCDLDLEAMRLHAALKVHEGFQSMLRVVGGGHDWPVWERGIVEVLELLAT
jgi:enterochelin esterase-like enzyme